MTVGDLIEKLQRYDPATRLVAFEVLTEANGGAAFNIPDGVIPDVLTLQPNHFRRVQYPPNATRRQIKEAHDWAW